MTFRRAALAALLAATWGAIAGTAACTAAGDPLPGSLFTDSAAVEYRNAVWAFREAFPDTVHQDSVGYGSLGHFEALYPDSLWEGWLTRGLSNERGELAWRRSRDVLALLVLYRTTGEMRFLHRAWRFSKAILDARDDRQGKTDYRGRTGPVWGSSAYGSGRRTDYLAHTGLIVEPILTTLAILDGKIGPPPGAGAPGSPAERRELLSGVIESLAHYDAEYRVRPDSSEGWYVTAQEEEERERMVQPFNRQNVVAWDLELLYLLTGDRAHRDRAAQLARFFKKRLALIDGDHYVWDYEAEESPEKWKGPYGASTCDDISHGWIALDPVVSLAEHGVVFTEEDLGRFARTLTRSIYRGRGVFFSAVGCQAIQMPRIMHNLPGWLCVADGDPDVLPLIRRFMVKNLRRPAPLFLAYLVQLSG